MPKFDEGCWNYHMIPVHSREVSILPSGANEQQNNSQNGKIVSDYFAETILPFWLLFCRWFGYYFTLVWKIDTTSLTCEWSCMLCPNFEHFFPNNGQFLSVKNLQPHTIRLCVHKNTTELKLVHLEPVQLKPLPFVITSRCSNGWETGPSPAWDTRRGEEFFERGPKFKTMSNSFKLYPTHFSRGGRKFF